MILTGALEPVKNEYGEQVILLIDGYPTALLHIDTFWQNKYGGIHQQLSEGKTVEVVIEFTAIDKQEEEQAAYDERAEALTIGERNPGLADNKAQI